MSKAVYRILIVDDEPDIREVLSYNLIREGYIVFTASNGREAIDQAVKCMPHLIILDVMMPGMDGVEVCEHIRSTDIHKNTVITFLSARSEDYSLIAGFSAGADDYIIKPVNLKVLKNKVKALLRRYNGIHKELLSEISVNKIKHGNIEIDKERHTVIKDGTEMLLPKKEFNLLLMLSSKPGKVFTRESILAHIWGEDVVVGGRTIDVHIRKLREKIGNDLIKTIKGVGYKFVE